MKAERVQRARLYLGSELPGVEHWAIAQGHVACTSTVSPAKGPGKRNEDAMGLFPISERAAVFAVADGCGGMPRGGEAADLAITCLRDALEGVQEDNLRTAILDGVEHADVAIREMGAGAATTLVVLEIRDSQARAYHIGDSELLIVGGRGRVRFQTISHSPVGYGVESGLLDEQSALDHEDRNIVSNLLGIGKMRIEIGPKIQLQSRDTILLGSDGLTDNLRLQELIDGVRKGPLAPAARALRDLAAERMGGQDAEAPSKPDDLTFALFRPR